MIAAPMPCIWFDDQAEEAAEFYARVIPNSIVGAITRYPNTGQDITGKEPGSVMTATVEINGATFMLLNGGPAFTPNEAVSFVLDCETQDEIDQLWEALVEGGGEHSQCGWLKDRFGVSWQVCPAGMNEFWESTETEQRDRAMAAMLQMGKLDIEQLRRAAAGDTAGTR